MAESSSLPKQQNVVEAATVIVFRHTAQRLPEILMIQRSKTLSFAGAAVVFPGGKVDEADHRLARALAGCPAEHAAARIAGIREVLEETGLLLGIHQRPSADEVLTARAMLGDTDDLAPVLVQFGWTLDLEQLVPFAHWLPTFKPGRIFDTRFYLADLGSGRVDLTPDLAESTKLFWASASEALAMVESGEIKMIYPTRRNLERLALFNSFAETADHARSTPIETVSPWIEHQGGIDMLRIPAGIGYPVTIAPLSQIVIS